MIAAGRKILELNILAIVNLPKQRFVQEGWLQKTYVFVDCEKLFRDSDDVKHSVHLKLKQIIGDEMEGTFNGALLKNKQKNCTFLPNL